MECMFFTQGATCDPIIEVLDVDGGTPATPDEVGFRIMDRIGGTEQLTLTVANGGVTIGTREEGEPLRVQLHITPTQSAALPVGRLSASFWFEYDGGATVRPIDDRVPIRVEDAAIEEI